jgi:hypothetical protein
MNAEAFALNLKFRQTVLGKERKEITQLVHRKLLLRTARLVLLVATPSAITAVALLCAAASGALRLSRRLLRSFFACRLWCAFLVAHSLFNSKRVLKTPVRILGSLLNKAKSLNRPVEVSADGQLRLAASLSERAFKRWRALP